MLTDNLPKHIADALGELLDAEQPEIDKLEKEIGDMLPEFFIQSATAKTLSYWEDLLGFDHPDGWSDERRKERIRARMLCPSPLTPKTLKETIEKAGGVEVELIEDADAQTVTVKFVGAKGVPKYLADIQREVELIRPLHIPVLYEFSFAIWADYETNTWEDLAAYTWGEIEEGASA
ncbi:MAG: putative phage tail protein [Christensenellaceae bacterium]